MSEYHFNEGAFQIPDERVIDRSTTALEIGSSNGKVSVVIARRAKESESLDALFEQTRESMAVNLRRFRAEPARETRVAGQRGIELEFTWMHDSGPMFHRMAMLELPDLILTVTVAGTDDRRAYVQKVFDAVLGTLKLRRRP